MMRADESAVLWDGAVEVHCFGAGHGDWALKGWTREEVEAGNPGITGKLDRLMRDHRVGRLYLPSPKEFNAKVVSPDMLRSAWPGNTVFRGVFADGVLLSKIGEACAIASADCPTIVGRSPSTLLVAAAHAGRDSLYDKDALLNGQEPRPHASVVHALADVLGPDLHAHVACGIAPEGFLHPADDERYGGTNVRRAAHLRSRWGEACAPDRPSGPIDLHALITAQFEERGIPRDRLSRDRVDTHGDRAADGHPIWQSHRRDKGGKRNLVLVIRRS